MNEIEQILQADPATPRLVVTYQCAEDGAERFQWGVVGNIPVLSLLGYLAQVQVKLCLPTTTSSNPSVLSRSCKEQVLVVLFHKDSKAFSYFVHPSIPTDPLVGMLETIKAAMVGSRLAQQQQAQRVQICGPDGGPMRM